MLSIEKISPTNISDHREKPCYQFIVTLVDKEGFRIVVNVGAKVMYDAREFAILVLERTGRVYGDGMYQPWSEEVRKHLANFWANETKNS